MRQRIEGALILLVVVVFVARLMGVFLAGVSWGWFVALAIFCIAVWLVSVIANFVPTNI